MNTDQRRLTDEIDRLDLTLHHLDNALSILERLMDESHSLAGREPVFDVIQTIFECTQNYSKVAQSQTKRIWQLSKSAGKNGGEHA